MKHFAMYKVSTAQGGSIDNIVVDVEYDTLEERQHCAWCQLLDRKDQYSAHYRVVMKLIKEMGVDKVKKQFCAALEFEKVA